MKELKDRITGVEKTTAERYHIRFDAFGWATIVISDQGDMLINSDWGDWCYTWGGGPSYWGKKNFKEFLVSSSPDYLGAKLGYDRETNKLDIEATRKCLRGGIIQTRRENYGSSVMPLGPEEEGKAEARRLWEDVDVFCDALEEGQSYAYHCAISEEMNEFFPELYELLVYNHTPRFRMLIEELLPVFLNILEGELDEQAGSV